MAWIFVGFPTLFCIFSIAINNLLLYCHVRSTVLQGQKRAMELERRLSTYSKDQAIGTEEDDDDNKVSSGRSSLLKSSGRSSSLRSLGSQRPSSMLRSSDKQWERVRDVGSQSFLYVGAYFLCFSATVVKQAMDGQGFDNVQGTGSIFLPLLMLQSIFLPAQGMSNNM